MKKLAVFLLAFLFAIPAFAAGSGDDARAGGALMEKLDDGTYAIGDLESWIAFRDAVNAGESFRGKIVRLDADLDLSSVGWTPIGTGYSDAGTLSEAEFQGTQTFLYAYGDSMYTVATEYVNGAHYYRLCAFSGTFNGHGHAITGLSSSVPDGFSGLFGYVSNGTVMNLDVFSASVSGDTAGGIAGCLEYGTIRNCRFDGEVAGSKAAGGIVGRAVGIPVSGSPQSDLIACVNFGSVTAARGLAGGIVGACVATGFDLCANRGKVVGDSAGGIVGRYDAGSVTSCLAEGSVNGHSYAGGIAGYWYTGLIQDCVSLASVSGGDDVGGTVGTHCYINWDYEGTNRHMASRVKASNSDIGRPFEPDPDQIKTIEMDSGIPGLDQE